MRNIILIFGCFILFGCNTSKQIEIVAPPSINTGLLKESLITTKDDLLEAGELNEKISSQLNKAMTLAEQIDVILEKIEKEQEKLKGKNVIELEGL